MSPPGLRIALLMALAPRKQGSMEDFLLGFAREALRRDHGVDLWLLSPVHPDFSQALVARGARLLPLAELQRAGLRAAPRLASYDVLHLGFLAPRSPPALAAQAAWPARVLHVAHSDFSPTASGLRLLLSRALDRAVLWRLHGLAAVSEHVRQSEARRLWLPAGRTRTLFNGVDTRRFHPRPRAPSDRIHLATTAWLAPHKGLPTLLRAVARLQDSRLRLSVIGDGPELPRLQALAHGLGLTGRVEFLGLRGDVHALLANCDIYVQPSLVEAFGLGIAEAMASGCAVVASRVGGIPEVVEHGRSGLLVPPGDEAALASALGFLARHPEERQRLGQAARQRACERFELQGAVRRHLDWCEEAVARR